MPKILFLTTAHNFDDDRIFFHQAKSLVNNNLEVKITSLTSDYIGKVGEVSIESKKILHGTSAQKIEFLLHSCMEFQPDCIIASEPLAVFSAKKYSEKRRIPIIYDITEWYPSMRMVAPFRGISKIFHAAKFFAIQVLAGFQSTHFIFGEKSKKFPLAYLFPFKKQLLLSYFPDNQYIYHNPIPLNKNEICLAYTGQPSKEKGIENFLKAAGLLQKRNPGLKCKILIVGSTRSEKDQKFFRDLLTKFNFKNIDIQPSTDFENFSKSVAEAHICFDLREKNLENNHCLPIKIFYYAAAGKAVIYSDLKATRDAVKVDKFGYLVNPEDTLEIVKKIELYLQNPKLYSEHIRNARNLFETEYNWAKIRDNFYKFVLDSLP